MALLGAMGPRMHVVQVPGPAQDWEERMLHALGFGAFPLVPGGHEADRGLGQHVMLSVVARQAALVVGVGGALGCEPKGDLLMLDPALVFAAATGDEGVRDELADLRKRLSAGHTVGHAFTDEIRPLLREVEHGLSKAALQEGHPLLDGAYHRLLVYTEGLLVIRMAESLYGGGLSPNRCLALLGQSAATRLSVVEAVAGLVAADGVIDRSERNLLRELVGLGGFTRTEKAMLRGEMKDPVATHAEIVRHLPDPTQRELLIKLVIFASLIDGELSAPEARYIAKLAEASGLSHDDLARLHLAIVQRFEEEPDLARDLRPGTFLKRANRASGHMVEAAARRNLEALVAEVRETGDLVQLLGRRARGELDEAEEERMRAQLLDIARTIPALAIFAAPGGALLLPILEKVLPFSLIPSEFQAQDRNLERDDEDG